MIAEHHPLNEVLSVAGPGRLTVSRSYFEPDRILSRDIRMPSGHTEAEQELSRPLPHHTSFVWGLGALVSAVLGAGLWLTSLREYPDSEMYAGLEMMWPSPSRPSTSWPHSANGLEGDDGAGVD